MLIVTTATTGVDLDPDGYTLTLDGAGQHLEANGQASFPVMPGTHDLWLSGVAVNCRARPGGTLSVAYSGTVDTVVTVDFAVDCVASLPSRFTNQILFVVSEGDGADVYAITPDGSGLVNVTHSQGTVHGAPSISPDGTKLAFDTRSRVPAYCDAGPCGFLAVQEVTVMNADRTAAYRLSHPGYSPAWSPDGLRIAYAVQPYSFAFCHSLGVEEADRTGFRVLVAASVRDYGLPAWSPDGTRLAFSEVHCARITPSTLALINADGSELTPLTSGPDSDAYPAWSPDGTLIAFTRWHGGFARIFVIHPDGTGLKALSPDSTSDVAPAWSRDGSQLAFVHASGETSDLFVMNADGGGRVNVTRGTLVVVAERPAWSPR